MEFKKEETKAALQLRDKLIEEAKEKRDLVESAEESNDVKRLDEWIRISWLLEVQMKEDFAEELGRMIETQQFNF